MLDPQDPSQEAETVAAMMAEVTGATSVTGQHHQSKRRVAGLPASMRDAFWMGEAAVRAAKALAQQREDDHRKRAAPAPPIPAELDRAAAHEPRA